MKNKVGFHTNCKCDDTSFEETLRNIKAAGFDHVMLDTNRSSLEDGISLAQNLGLTVDFVHLPFRPSREFNLNAFWAFGKANKMIIKSIIDQIETCAKFGVPVVILHPSHEPHKHAHEIQSEKQGIKSFRKILEATKATGVKIAIENLGLNDTKYMRLLLDNIKDDSLGFCYDCGHHYLSHDTKEVDFLTLYGDRVFAIHLHDNLMEGYDRDLHLLPFDGKIDFKKVMRDIAKSSYYGVVLLESKRQNKNQPPADFLCEAKIRAEKLAEMLDTAKTTL